MTWPRFWIVWDTPRHRCSFSMLATYFWPLYYPGCDIHHASFPSHAQTVYHRYNLPGCSSEVIDKSIIVTFEYAFIVSIISFLVQFLHAFAQEFPFGCKRNLWQLFQSHNLRQLVDTGSTSVFILMVNAWYAGFFTPTVALFCFFSVFSLSIWVQMILLSFTSVTICLLLLYVLNSILTINNASISNCHDSTTSL